MDTLHIVKYDESFRVYYNEREAEFQSLEEAVGDNAYSIALKDYIFEIFRNPHIQRLSIWGCGDSWWAEAEMNNNHLIEEDGYRPHTVIAQLLLNIENNEVSS